MKLERNFGEEYSLEVDPAEDTGGKTACHPEGRTTDEEKAVCGACEREPAEEKNWRTAGAVPALLFPLGILPKNRPPVSPKQLHFLLREDLAKLEQISRETRLLCRCHIDTDEQLFSYKGSLQEQMAQLSKERQRLRYQCRSIKDEEHLAEVKAEISSLTARIGELRGGGGAL